MSRNRQEDGTRNPVLPLYLLAGVLFSFGAWAWASGQQDENSSEMGATVLYALPFAIAGAAGGLGCAIQKWAPGP